MFCRNCGNELSNEAIMCPKCTEPTDSINNLNYCKNCGAKTEEGQTICSNCGASVTKFGLETSGWKTREIKDIAKKMSVREDVRGNMIFNILYLIPVIILSMLLSFAKLEVNPYSIFQNSLLSIIEAVVMSVFIYNVTAKTARTIKTGSAKFDFEFNGAKWIPFLIVTVIIGLISGIQTALTNLDTLLSWLGGTHYGFVLFILLILLLILGVIAPFIYYVSVARDFDTATTFKVGIKYGFKNFGKLLVLDLSFIPLILLVVLTLGILMFWKGYYIMLSGSVLFEKILIKEGFPSETQKAIDNLNETVNSESDSFVDLTKEPSSNEDSNFVDLSKENDSSDEEDTNKTI
ncbi:MAG: zinc-ribbon domain-containing protein [Clostridium sp.]|uniref:zinc-ribbon domain-containing protein n=1 Tax=Clostridium sp. TaxID=1506 RepID=UPI003F3609AA